MHLQVFFFANHFQVGMEKNEGHTVLEKYENYTNCTLGTPSSWDTLGDTDITPMALGVVRHKSPSVGEIGEDPATQAVHTKDGAGSILLKKENNEKRVGHMKVQEKKERKRERKIYI